VVVQKLMSEILVSLFYIMFCISVKVGGRGGERGEVREGGFKTKVLHNLFRPLILP